jgi:hypothetical protein
VKKHVALLIGVRYNSFSFSFFAKPLPIMFWIIMLLILERKKILIQQKTLHSTIEEFYFSIEELYCIKDSAT